MTRISTVFGGVLYGISLGFIIFAITYAFWGFAIMLAQCVLVGE